MTRYAFIIPNHSTIRALAACFALLTALLLSVSSAEAVKINLVHDGPKKHVLPIGRDLKIQLTETEKSTRYFVYLVDETDDRMASLLLSSGPTGHVRLATLWKATGVQGCNPGANHDLDSYQFKSIEEAEDVLHGRAFKVLVYAATRLQAANLVASSSFEAAREELAIRAFPSNHQGCFQTYFPPEEPFLYLSIRHNDPAPRTFLAYVVPAQETWQPGDPLVDLRVTGPSIVHVPPGPHPTVQLLLSVIPFGSGSGAPMLEAQIILRPVGPNPEPDFQPGDFVAGPRPTLPAGATYEECIGCPPP